MVAVFKTPVILSRHFYFLRKNVRTVDDASSDAGFNGNRSLSSSSSDSPAVSPRVYKTPPEIYNPIIFSSESSSSNDPPSVAERGKNAKGLRRAAGKLRVAVSTDALKKFRKRVSKSVVQISDYHEKVLEIKRQRQHYEKEHMNYLIECKRAKHQTEIELMDKKIEHAKLTLKIEEARRRTTTEDGVDLNPFTTVDVSSLNLFTQ